MSDWSSGLCWLPGCDEAGFLLHKPDSTLPSEMALAYQKTINEMEMVWLCVIPWNTFLSHHISHTTLLFTLSWSTNGPLCNPPRKEKCLSSDTEIVCECKIVTFSKSCESGCSYSSIPSRNISFTQQQSWCSPIVSMWWPWKSTHSREWLSVFMYSVIIDHPHPNLSLPLSVLFTLPVSLIIYTHTTQHTRGVSFQTRVIWNVGSHV